MPVLGPYQLRNPYVLAPMAGVSEMPFRVLAFKMGAALCPTELVSAQGLFRASSRTIRYLRHDPEVEKPYSLQIFGGEPEVMARAAQIGEATSLPVTAKIRSGWDANSHNYIEVAGALEDAGCAALAIHPRTRAQGYSGFADWRAIAELKKRIRRMPIIGNGDVRSPADARRMRETTGCDFVMIGRAALGNPWIFRQLTGGQAPSVEERCATILLHLEQHIAFVGDERAAVRAFRKHLAWYAHGLRGAAAFRAEVNQLELADQVRFSVRRFFSQAAGGAEVAGEQE